MIHHVRAEQAPQPVEQNVLLIILIARIADEQNFHTCLALGAAFELERIEGRDLLLDDPVDPDSPTAKLKVMTASLLLPSIDGAMDRGNGGGL
jgi:hypothetical protein